MTFIRSMLKKYWYMILFVVLWWWFRRNDNPFTFDHTMDVIAYGAIFVFIVIKYLNNLGKYKSPQFIGNGFHASIAARPILVNDWYLFRLGGIDCPGLPRMEGNEASAIAHRLTVKMVGDCVITTARMQPIPKERIPTVLKDHFDRQNFPDEKVLIGYASPALEAEDPRIVDFEEQIGQRDEILNMLKDNLQGKYGFSETVLGSMGRMGKEFQKGKRWKLIHRDKPDDDD